MSRSFKKSCNNFGGYCGFACYFSNKKAKRQANQRFRTVSKRQLKKIINLDDLDEDNNIYKVREVSNVWDFPSDGLAHYIRYNKNWSDDDKRRIRMK